ncbi:hypothetical protein HERIO_657 [Hepatospora eriocheir]|uniref:Uncharacterized protein n=1 Tax=Hepatospora eriocheir TaxID=1081669 RepID=A0A1X0QCH7_9MICR|nr:hypothetical protein HERIO_657 [Hepatospora eriocheir]
MLPPLTKHLLLPLGPNMEENNSFNCKQVKLFIVIAWPSAVHLASELVDCMGFKRKFIKINFNQKNQ